MSVFVNVVVGVLLWTGSEGRIVAQTFVQTGSDVTLDVMDSDVLLEGFYALQWKFNNDVLVFARPHREARVSRETVGFHPQNLSVTLKNLQKTDSGRYEAQLGHFNEHPIIASFSILVQDPVSPVTVTVDSVSNTAESCKFTVSCSTEGLHMGSSFTCDKQMCDNQEGNKTITPSGASLHLYLSNVLVICNHSNQVSWTNNTADIQKICPTEKGSESVLSVCALKSAVFSVGLVFMVSAVITVHILECRHNKHK